MSCLINNNDKPRERIIPNLYSVDNIALYHVAVSVDRPRWHLWVPLLFMLSSDGVIYDFLGRYVNVQMLDMCSQAA